VARRRQAEGTAEESEGVMNVLTTEQTRLLLPTSALGRLRATLHGLWKKHKSEDMLPTSGRFLYYELVAASVISKTVAARTDGKKGRRSDQNMTDALTDLREAGIIPWNDIADETREFTQWLAYPSIKDAMRSAWKHTRIDLWGNDSSPVILCESRSLGGVLERLAQEYQAPIGSTNGQTAGFLHTQVGPALTPRQRVLYLGDLDKSGLDIEANTRSVLEEIVGSSLQWERVAITEEQADEKGLEPIRKYDKRTKSHHSAIETEALGQGEIVRLLRRKLRKLMPDARRRDVLEREEAERIAIGRKLGYEKQVRRRPSLEGGAA
jgi:hypothetical protein